MGRDLLLHYSCKYHRQRSRVKGNTMSDGFLLDGQHVFQSRSVFKVIAFFIKISYELV